MRKVEAGLLLGATTPEQGSLPEDSALNAEK